MNTTTINLFKKVLSSKASFSILHDVKVENGYAYASDLETYLKIPCELKYGMYDCVAFIAYLKYGTVPSIENIDANEFPEFPTVDNANSIDFPIDKFKWVENAISGDVSQYTLNGILVDGSVACGIDGRKMFLQNVNLPIGEHGYILNPITLMMGNCKASFNELYCMLENDDLTMCSKLINGKFPNYKMFIPEKYDHTLTFHRDDFMHVLKISKHEMNKDSKKLVFKVFKDHILLAHEDGKTVYQIDSQCDTELTLGLNCILFSECIEPSNDEMVTIHFNNAESPFSIDKTNERTIILMPMKLDGTETIPDTSPQYISCPQKTTKKPKNTHKNTENDQKIESLQRENEALKNRILELERMVAEKSVVAKESIQLPIGIPSNAYTVKHAEIINRLAKKTNNSFASSLLEWIKMGKEFTPKQYVYAMSM